MSDKRETKRLLTSIFIKYSVGETGDMKFGGFTRDVSLDGIGLMASYPLKLNADIEMSIDIPNNPDLTLAEGNVRWISKQPVKDEMGNPVYLTGIAFTNIDKQDKEYLKDYLENNLIV